MNGRMSGKPTTALISHPITEEELRATPMRDLNAVREIKEQYPKRLTKNIEKYFGDERMEHTALMGVYVRLKDIEDIIYGEGENK